MKSLNIANGIESLFVMDNITRMKKNIFSLSLSLSYLRVVLHQVL